MDEHNFTFLPLAAFVAAAEEVALPEPDCWAAMKENKITLRY